jgi:hypothetical protein
MREPVMTENATLIIECDAEVAQRVTEVFRECEADVQGSPEQYLDGSQIDSWVLVVGIALRTSPRIIDALGRFLTRNNLKSISVGDLTIENPKREDLPELFATIQAGRTE